MPYVAITTRYAGPTNNSGARIIARGSGGGKRVILPYPHEKNGEKAHRDAAIRLIIANEWHGTYAVGAFERGYVYVSLGNYPCLRDHDDVFRTPVPRLTSRHGFATCIVNGKGAKHRKLSRETLRLYAPDGRVGAYDAWAKVAPGDGPRRIYTLRR